MRNRKEKINCNATLTIWQEIWLCLFFRYSCNWRDSYRCFFFRCERERLTTDITTAGPIRPFCCTPKRVLRCAGMFCSSCPSPSTASVVNCVTHVLSSFLTLGYLSSPSLLSTGLCFLATKKVIDRSVQVSIEFASYSRETPQYGEMEKFYLSTSH